MICINGNAIYGIPSWQNWHKTEELTNHMKERSQEEKLSKLQNDQCSSDLFVRAVPIQQRKPHGACMDACAEGYTIRHASSLRLDGDFMQSLDSSWIVYI